MSQVRWTQHFAQRVRWTQRVRQPQAERREGEKNKVSVTRPLFWLFPRSLHECTLQLLVKWWHICISRLIIKSACYSGYDECKRRGHDEVLGSEPHCPQSGFQESLIPSCEVFKHGFHRGGVDFFWNKPYR